jgi:hypothetical protein
LQAQIQGFARKMAFGILQALDSANAVEDPDRIYGDIHDIADELRSLAISIREAAFRQDRAWLRIRRAELVRRANLLAGLVTRFKRGQA